MHIKKLPKYNKKIASLLPQNIPPRLILFFGLIIVSFSAYFILKQSFNTPPLTRNNNSSPYLFAARNNLYHAQIGLKNQNTPSVSFNTPDYPDSQINFSLINSQNPKPPTQNRNTLIYKDVFSGIDLTYQTTQNGVKEEIILKEPTSRTTFDFDLKLQGTAPKTILNNFFTPYFYDDQGNYLFHFEKPFAYDASGNRTDNVTLQIRYDQQTDQYITRLSIDKDWLYDPARTYPIHIDPTIVHDTSAEFNGEKNRVTDTGSGSDPRLETYYQQLDSDPSTIALWHFNETSENSCLGGEDACDSSGNGHHGVASAGATITSNGLLDYARSYDNATGYVNISDGSSFNVSQLTIEAWVYNASFSTSSDFVFEKTIGGTVNTQYSLFFDSSGSLYFRTYNTSAAQDNLTLTTANYFKNNEWNHVAAVFTGNKKLIYVNGQLAASKEYSQTLRTGTGNAIIGAYGSGTNYFFDGMIDEMRISNTARSAEEIKLDSTRRPYSVYTSPSIDLTNVTSWNSFTWNELGVATGDGETATRSSALVAQWNFNETSGTTAANNAGAGTCGGTPTNCDGGLNGFIDTSGQGVALKSGWIGTYAHWGAGALQLDGSNDYVLVNNDSSIDPNQSDPFTIEAWVNTNKTGTQGIINKQENVTNEFVWGLSLDSTNHPAFGVSKQNVTGISATSPTPIESNKWYHLVGISDGTNIYLYINGRLQATTAISFSSATQNVSDMHIGRFYNNTYYFSGIIDTTRYYNVALTPSDILSNYNAGNIELQTRVSADNSTWEAWKPVTGETQIDSFDTASNWATPSGDLINLEFVKTDNSTPSNSDTTGTNGRIPLGTAGKGDSNSVQSPTIIKDGSTYKMWYAGNDGTNLRIYYATSSDGLTWTKYDNTIPSNSDTTGTNGRIPLGTAGKGDSTHAYEPVVIKDGSTYKMWYSGSDGTNPRVYYATSSDGLTWTKYDNTIPSNSDTTTTNGRLALGTAGKGDTTYAYTPTVIKDGSTYKMWYSGYNGSNIRIYYATSPDGLTWTKYDNTIPAAGSYYNTNGRIGLSGTGWAFDVHAYYPTVVKDGDLYRMWFTGHDGTDVRIMSAYSHDGLTWNIFTYNTPQNSNIADRLSGIGLGAANSGDDRYAHTAKALLEDNHTISIWYGGNDGATYRVYRATANTQSVPIPRSSDTNIKLEGSASTKFTSGSFEPNAKTRLLLHLDETNGDNVGSDVFDSSGNGNDGEFDGSNIASAVTEGAIGKARSFNGSDDRITIPHDSSISGLHGITIMAWVKPQGSMANYDIILNKENEYEMAWYDSQLVSAIYTDTTTWAWTSGTGTNTLPLDTWTHVAVTWDGANVRQYINGVSINTTSLGGSTLNPTTNDLWIGNRSAVSGNEWPGSIDEVVIQDGPMSISEIQAAYRAGRGHHINQTISSTDMSSDNKIAFDIAAEEPGTYLNTTIGESSFVNHETDTNTVAYHHFDNEVVDGAFWVNDSSNYHSDSYKFGTDNVKGGKYGNAQYFNASSSDYLLMGNQDMISTFDSGNAYSVDFWINPTAYPASWSWIFSKAYTSHASPYYQFDIRLTPTGQITSQVWGLALAATTTQTLSLNQWHYVAVVVDTSSSPSTLRIYIDGYLDAYASVAATSYTNYNTWVSLGANINIASSTQYNLNGSLDDFRISNVYRTPNDILQSYLYDRRTHPITIDFAASLDSGNLIANNVDTSFTIDATTKGLDSPGSNLYLGDTIIVKENDSGTDYIAQGVVNSINASTGAVTVSSWDANSTFPTGGFTTNATVFKWQTEYFDISNIPSSQKDAITNFTITPTGRLQNYTFWLDDLRRNTNYLTDPTGSTITSSTGDQYFQYRAIISSTDYDVSPKLGSVSLDYTQDSAPTTPIINDSYLHDNLYLADTTPEVRFASSDPDNDDIVYEIWWDTDSDFSSASIATSSADAGFANVTTPADTSPFNTGDTIGYTFQSPLSNNTTYFYRLKAIDSDNTTLQSNYSVTRSFTINTSLTLNSWFQTHADQFSTDTLSGAAVVDNGSNYVYLSSSSPGTITSTSITAANIDASPATWGQLIFNDNETSGDIKYYVYYDVAGTPTIVPDGDLTGNSTGFDTSPVSLSSLSTTTYPILYVRAELTDSSGSPQLQDWQLTFNQAPTPPSDLYAEGTTNPTGIIDLTPEFSAIYNDNNTSDNAVYYQIQVNTQSDFAGTTMWDSTKTSMSPLSQGVRSTDVSYAGTSLSYDGSTYYWRIRFWDSEGSTGDWSTETASFTTNQPPNIPTLNSPSDTQTNVGLTPTLITTGSDTDSDYLQYKIELCTDLAMTTACQTFDQTSSQTGWYSMDQISNTAYTSGHSAFYIIQTPLSAETTYYWRSYAIDPQGSNTFGNTQATPYSFTTTRDLPAACYLEKSADNSSITIHWTDNSSNEDGYDVDRSVNSAAFGNLTTAAADATSHIDSTVSNGNSYQYRIRSFVGSLYSNYCYTSTINLDSGNLNLEDLKLEDLQIQ